MTDHSNSRCEDCVWARVGNVVLVDPFASSHASTEMPALWCHRERPRERVDPDAFCPDFERRAGESQQ